MNGNRLGLGKVPSPLEIVDAALDSVAEVAILPARLVSNVAQAVEKGSESVKAGISRPKDIASVPAPPDSIIQGGLEAATGAVNGVIEGIGGIFRSIQETGDGVRRQLDALRK